MKQQKKKCKEKVLKEKKHTGEKLSIKAGNLFLPAGITEHLMVLLAGSVPLCGARTAHPLEGTLQVQYNIISIDSICGMLSITAENNLDSSFRL